uniref:Uncharacterized protein n=1 Tax=Octactis speculum TaxID=3111310 RepID=A0A7S2DZD6_9STRA|mmetsp:Transcript_56286/g.76780  ORF Transcript_56286/g.76780 Transcript_56286/m.76780 type:complete len:153 (+) Transcript_56286:137-595(+)
MPFKKGQQVKRRAKGKNIGRCHKGRRVDGRVTNPNAHPRVIVQPNEPRPWAIKSGPRLTRPLCHATDPPAGTSVVKCDTVSDEARRVAIAVYYLEAMDAPPACEDNETAPWILRQFKMPPGSLDVVKRVLNDVRKCAVEGTEYTGEQQLQQR